MKAISPALIFLVGLGSFISCKHPASPTRSPSPVSNMTKPAVRRIGQPSIDPNPFDRYLENVKRNWPESSLVSFAKICRIDVDATAPKFAQRPEQKWVPVRDLSKALKDQETDFYGTLAVWSKENRLLVEQWGMELDTGDYYRLFYCVNNQKITDVESTSWRLELDENSSKDTGWGYVHRWSLGSDGKFTTVSRGFIDLNEKPTPEPKLDADTQQGLNEEAVGMKTLADLKIPKQMTQ